MALPLSGVKVIEFGSYLAGPLVSRLLLDAGADVTRIDRPDHGEEVINVGAEHILNEGKERCVVALSTACEGTP